MSVRQSWDRSRSPVENLSVLTERSACLFSGAGGSRYQSHGVVFCPGIRLPFLPVQICPTIYLFHWPVGVFYDLAPLKHVFSFKFINSRKSVRLFTCKSPLGYQKHELTLHLCLTIVWSVCSSPKRRCFLENRGCVTKFGGEVSSGFRVYCQQH